MSTVTAFGIWKNTCGATGKISEVEFEEFPKTLTIPDPFREAGSLSGDQTTVFHALLFSRGGNCTFDSK